VLDNWPHPLGVVPSHLTLGAVLYYRPLFMRLRGSRTGRAPPVFVLDRNRLARYTDEETQFDNRYVARLPTATNLQSLGIRRVLYIAPDQSDMRELDDLNADFVAFRDASIDVKVMPLSDLMPPAQQAQSHGYYYGATRTRISSSGRPMAGTRLRRDDLRSPSAPHRRCPRSRAAPNIGRRPGQRSSPRAPSAAVPASGSRSPLASAAFRCAHPGRPAPSPPS